MVKLALDNLLIALHATTIAAQLTAKLVNGALTQSTNPHVAFKFAPAHALSKSIHRVVVPSAHLLSATTPPPLAVLLTVSLTIGARGLSAHPVFPMVSFLNHKQEVERSSFNLHAVVRTVLAT